MNAFSPAPEVVLPFMLALPRKSRKRQSSPPIQHVNPMTDSVDALKIKLSTLKSRGQGDNENSKLSTRYSVLLRENRDPERVSLNSSWTSSSGTSGESNQSPGNGSHGRSRAKSCELILDSSDSLEQQGPLLSVITPLSECCRASSSRLEEKREPRLSLASMVASSRFILPARQQQQHQQQQYERESPEKSVHSVRSGSNNSSSKLIMAAGKPRSPGNLVSPQDYLESLLQERGYQTSGLVRRALDTAFFCHPTDWQKASYGPLLVQAVRSGNVQQLRDLLQHLSANPCSIRGESLWHMVCRRGDAKLLQVLMEHESAPSLCQTVSTFGRTVLHEACWSSQPAFDLVQQLLDLNPLLLFLQDGRGALPLSYIPSNQWGVWRDFLDEQADAWFPKSGQTWQYRQALEWLHLPPHSKPLEEPLPKVSLDMASKIASGQTSVILEFEADFQLPEDYDSAVEDCNDPQEEEEDTLSDLGEWDQFHSNE